MSYVFGYKMSQIILYNKLRVPDENNRPHYTLRLVWFTMGRVGSLASCHASLRHNLTP